MNILCLISGISFTMDLLNTINVPIFTKNLTLVPRLDSYDFELKFGNSEVFRF